MSFKLDRALSGKLAALLSKKLDAAAEEGALVVYEKTAAGPRSGTHYPGQPRQSSAPGESIQEQTGEARSGISWRPTSDPLTKEVFIEGDIDKLTALALDPESEGGRDLLHRELVEPEAMRRMRERMK